MNRRGFFQTVAATIAAIFLPKSKKAEVEGGEHSDLTFNTGIANDGVTIHIYTDNLDGTWRYYNGAGWISFHPKHRGFIVLKENNNG